jgi:hypothetical protein
MRARFDARAAALRPLALLTALGLGCADPRPTEPTAAPDFARGGGTGPTVTATSPSFGEQGTASLDVQITGSGFDWTTPTPLEDTSRFCSVITRGNNITSVAYAINEAGIIVGQSCNVAVAWRPSGSGYSRILLGDLGNHPATGLARAINNAASPIAVGTVGQGVYWHDF